MNLTATTIDPDIFTVANVFDDAECEALIQRAESIGFDAASVRTESGPKMLTNIRNNDRVNLDDPELADLMWDRIHCVLPPLDGLVARGVDRRLRFYRYEAGQVFRRHKDGSATSETGLTSKLSYLIYLNEGFEGGSTTFRDYVGTGDDRTKTEYTIVPVTGSALLFRHQRWHEGSPVLAGRKYVLRSDVFYGVGDENGG